MLRLGMKAVCAWVLCLIVAGCASTVGGTAVSTGGKGPTATSAPPKHLVAAADLPKLLLPLDEIKDIMKSPGMATNQTWNQPDATDTHVVPVECLGAAFGGEALSYNGSGFTAFYGVRQVDPHVVPDVDEALAAFKDAKAAKSFVSKSVAQWRQCAGKVLMQPWPDGTAIPWKLGDPAESGGMATNTSTAVLSPDLAVVRALAAKSNVVVDLQLEGIRLAGDEAPTIVKRILDRIPA